MNRYFENCIDLRELLNYITPDTMILLVGLDEPTLNGQRFIGNDQWRIVKAKYGSLKVLSVKAISRGQVKIMLAGRIDD